MAKLCMHVDFDDIYIGCSNCHTRFLKEEVKKDTLFPCKHCNETLGYADDIMLFHNNDYDEDGNEAADWIEVKDKTRTLKDII